MALYKVLQMFRNRETKEVYKVGQEIELSVKRANEVIENLKDLDGEFLERIDTKNHENNQEVDA